MRQRGPTVIIAVLFVLGLTVTGGAAVLESDDVPQLTTDRLDSSLSEIASFDTSRSDTTRADTDRSDSTHFDTGQSDTTRADSTTEPADSAAEFGAPGAIDAAPSTEAQGTGPRADDTSTRSLDASSPTASTSPATSAGTWADRESERRVAPRNLQPAQVSAVDGLGSDRVDLLQVIATDTGESLSYRFTVRGDVQKTRLNDRVQAGQNDEVVDDGDGTTTVRGRTANGFGDAYLYAGEVVSFERTGGSSTSRLTLNSLEVTRDELLEYDVLEVISTDQEAQLSYEFTVRGTVEPTQTDDGNAADDDDGIVGSADGTTIVRGSVADQDGDAYLVDGELVDFRAVGGESGFFTRLDGMETDLSGVEPPDGSDGGGDGDPTPIQSCTVIDSPGAYELTADVDDASAAACLRIESSDVALEGGGHVIDGSNGSDTVGILVGTGTDAVDNVTVRNVVVREWDDGVYVGRPDGAGVGEPFSNARFEGVTSTANLGAGVWVESWAEDVVVTDSTIRDNGGVGLALYYFGGNDTIANNTVSGNGGTGIQAFEGGRDLTIRDNAVSGNADGVTVSNDVVRPRIVDNRIAANAGRGISIAISRNATIEGNRIESNQGSGIEASDSSADRIVDNAIVGNDVGVRLDSVRDSLLQGNNASTNVGHGIVLERAERNRLARNRATRNGGSGIALVGAFTTDNTIVENVACDNAADEQISVDGESTGNELADNVVDCP